MAVPEPITRLEKYWAAILDKIQGGGSAPVLETLTVKSNDTYTPDEGVDGFDCVNVQVPDPVLETLNVTANGTYTPGEGVVGFDEAIVGVEQEWQSITVTGTLDAPFTLANWLQLVDADEIYGRMTIDATAIGSGTANVPFASIVPSTGIIFSVCDIPSTTVSDVNAAQVVIVTDFENQTVLLGHAKMMQQGAIVDLSQYASLMPTTTTFVYHITPSND